MSGAKTKSKAGVNGCATRTGSADPAKVEADARRIKAAAKSKREALQELADADAIANDALGGAPQDLDPEPDPEPERKIERIVRELNQEGTFIVRHLRGNEALKIGRFALSTWPDQMEKIAHEKGGGTFQIEFRDESGHVAGSVTEAYDEQTYSKGLPKIDPGASQIERMFAVMEARDQQHRIELAAAQKESRDIFFKMLELNANKKNEGLGIKDVIEMAKTLNGPQKSALGEVREVLELVNDIRSDGDIDPPTQLENLIGKGMSMAKPLLDAAARKLAEDPAGEGSPRPLVMGERRPPELASPAPGQPPAAASVPLEDERIKAYADSLRDVIANDMTPEVAAMVTTAGAASEPEAKANLLDFAQRPDVADQVIKYAPDLEPARDWLLTFFKAIVSEWTLPAADAAPEVIPNPPAPEKEEAQAVADTTA